VKLFFGEQIMKLLPPNAPFHLLLELRHHTRANGVPEDWSSNDRFRVHQGADEGLLYVYRSAVQSDIAAHDTVTEFGYPDCVAHGHVRARDKEWIFVEPNDSDMCVHLIQRLVTDATEILRYFGKHRVITPTGSAKLIRDYAT
jgi:hypothetical protein